MLAIMPAVLLFLIATPKTSVALPIETKCQTIKKASSPPTCLQVCFENENLTTARLFENADCSGDTFTSLTINVPPGDPYMQLCYPCGGEQSVACGVCGTEDDTCTLLTIPPGGAPNYMCDQFKYANAFLAIEQGPNSPTCFRDKYGRSVCTP
jgi:hypothetical protein